MEKHIRISRFLSWVLRHAPGEIGLRIDREGWVELPELIRCSRRKGIELTPRLVREIAETDRKGRYQLSECRGRIRAVYGHSIEVCPAFQAEQPPPVLYHGTAARNLDSIMKKGLDPRKRRYVHLSSGPETAMEVGRRHGKAILLEIDAGAMHQRGIEFYRPAGDIWLTEKVDRGYIRIGYHQEG